MHPWLRNPQWTVYAHPRQEGARTAWSWSWYGNRRDGPFLEMAGFALEVNQFLRRMRLAPGYDHIEAQEVDAAGRRGRIQWMDEETGLATALEMALHESLPLLQWRVTWQVRGPGFRVRRAIPLQVGPIHAVERKRGLQLGPGHIPLDFLRRERPPEHHPGVLRLHPSPARPVLFTAVATAGGPTLVRYDQANPYRPPQKEAVLHGPPLPKPRTPDHAATRGWAVLWDPKHRQGLALAAQDETMVVEALLHPLHPGVHLWYWPKALRWRHGHEETTPWVGLAWFTPEDPAPLETLFQTLQPKPSLPWPSLLEQVVR